MFENTFNITKKVIKKVVNKSCQSHQQDIFSS